MIKFVLTCVGSFGRVILFVFLIWVGDFAILLNSGMTEIQFVCLNSCR